MSNLNSEVKMRPLITSQRMLIWLCLCPGDENISKRDKFHHILFTFTLYVIAIITFACSAAHFSMYLRIDLEKSLYSLFQISAVISVTYTTITVFFLRHKIAAIFMNLSEIYKASESRFDTILCLLYHFT